jgi:site-specific DNA recombinase
MKTAAIYARVSTEDQTRGTSLNGQLDTCRQYATEQGYTVVKEIAEDFTASRLDRPGLTVIRDMVERGELEAVVVYDPDRLSRKNTHMWMLMDEFERKGVQLLFVNVPREDTPEGRMLFGMRSLFAEYEREKTRERTRLGSHRRAKEGKILGSNLVPYGYSYIIGEGRYEVLPDEAQIVRQIFRWMAFDKMSLYRIAARLTSMGVLTKRGRKAWRVTAVFSILNNTSYIGMAYWNKTMSVIPKTPKTAGPRKREASSQVKRDASQWIGIPVPPIVEQELFEAAQRQLQANKKHSARNCKNEYLLRGFMACSTCGYGLYGQVAKSRIRNYACGGKNPKTYSVGQGLGHKCPTRYYNADDLESRVWSVVVKQLTEPEQVLGMLAQKGQAWEKEQQRNEGELEALYTAEQALKREHDKMLNLYTVDVLTLEQLQERLAIIKKKQSEIDASKAEISEQVEKRKTVQANAEAIEDLCRWAKKGLPHLTFKEKRQLLESLQLRVTVSMDSLTISGIISDTIPINEGATGENHRIESIAVGC